jgi:hypothetical protein
MLLILIPTIWFTVATLFAAVCRVASYGESVQGRGSGA